MSKSEAYQKIYKIIENIATFKLESGSHEIFLKKDLHNLIDKERKKIEGYNDYSNKTNYISDQDVIDLEKEIVTNIIDDPIKKFSTKAIPIGDLGQKFTLTELITKSLDDSLVLKEIDGKNIIKTIDIIKKNCRLYISAIWYKRYRKRKNIFRFNNKR